MRLLKQSILIALVLSLKLYAQQPKKLNSSEIYEAVQKLNVLASVLYLAAHPDDENTRLIAYMANEVKARTAYLSLTRGDGGQNLIGPELREQLGVIRTQELLAARRIDGGEQLFSRANDFGFSKHPDETFEIWDKNQVLADVVWAIRTFKPDIIINRFDHRTPGKTHGHHTASAMLSMEAFDLTNDKNKFPSQLKYTAPWQAKRIFFNTSWWFYGSRANFEKADKSQMTSMDIGVYYPLKGISNNEIAALASSQHLCQGFGRLSQRGTQPEYIEFLKGEPLKDKDPLSGIDTSWNRIEGGQSVGKILKSIEDDFNFKDPAAHLPNLMKAYQLLQDIKDEHWKNIKSNELKNIIEACAGLYLEASAESPTSIQNNTMRVDVEILNRSKAKVFLNQISLPNGDEFIQEKELVENLKETLEIDYKISSEDWQTSPYWLKNKWSLGMYEVKNQNLIGRPETPKSIKVNFDLIIEGVPLRITKPVIHRYSKPDQGELYRPLEIVPAVTSQIKDQVIIFNSNTPKKIEVLVKAHQNEISGVLSLNHPKDWKIEPKSQSIAIKNKGDVKSFTFEVTPPKTTSEGSIAPVVQFNGKVFDKKSVEINYSHIPFQTLILPNESKVVKLEVKKSGTKIGYIEGAGDVVPQSLEQIGYTVDLINPENITAKNLNQYDAVVLGIRAYNVVDALAFKQQFLLDYVKQGGNLIVQYNTNRRLKIKNIAPYTLKLSRDRVTDETATMKILEPNHPLLNWPNKISIKDFEGWVQERGLYFPNEWGDDFTALLSCNDKNEAAKKGSLLIAPYGKGNYIYTGLSFFREFPAGIPGAYRLFANLLSAKQTNKN